MKKLIYLLIFILCLSGCSGKYKGWNEIELQGLGSIKIPQGWTCHIKGDEIYFTDEGVTKFSEDSVHLAGFINNEGEEIKTGYRMFDKNAESIGNIKSEVFSNSTYRGIKAYIMHGKRCEKAYLELDVIDLDKEICMIVWDDSVTYEDVGKMAKSFKGIMLD